MLHAQEWDDDYSLQGKRAAIIGTGSTGVQLIPKLAEDVAELTVYQRTPIWVMPKFDLSFGPWRSGCSRDSLSHNDSCDFPAICSWTSW